MVTKRFLKNITCQAMLLCGVDRFLRHVYRERLIVVMYHGITPRDYQPAVWTQLPLRIFERQIEWLKQKYNPITLTEMIGSIKGLRRLPENAVLITFDDGLKNNHTVAFPVLRKYNVPATIFLTVDYIGSDRFFWFDEIYMVLVKAHQSRMPLLLFQKSADVLFRHGDVWDAYRVLVESLKRIPVDEQRKRVDAILNQVNICRDQYQSDFGMLTWDDVKSMAETSLIEFGVHTANHRILTAIKDEALEDELLGAKQRLEAKLGQPVTSFCYPNGGFGQDYLPKHWKMLKCYGYECAFATNNGFFIPRIDNRFAIPRIAAGNDVTSDDAFFKTNVSGLLEFKSRIFGRSIRFDDSQAE